MTQPTASSTEGQPLVSPPGKGPIPPDQALYKVKWSKYNFNKKIAKAKPQEWVKVGFHYPSSRPEFSGRQLGPWTRVVETDLKWRDLV